MSAFEDARAGHGRLVLISGEAGLGKSRLLYELRTQLEAHDVMWLTGRCISYGADIPYVPVVDLIKDASGIEEADGETAMVAKLDAAVEAVNGDPANLPYLRYLLSVDPGDPAIAEQEPDAPQGPGVRVLPRRAHVRRVAATRRAGRSRTPIGSTRSRRSCCRSSSDSLPDHGVLLLLTHRPEWEPPFGERPYYTNVRLPILSESDAISLAAGRDRRGRAPRVAPHHDLPEDGGQPVLHRRGHPGADRGRRDAGPPRASRTRSRT